MRRAIYAGSFDPPTNGHIWMIEQGSRLFDQLIVAIGVNPDKKCLLSLEERLELLTAAIRYLSNVSVQSFENQFLVRYARSVGISYILRGIRNPADFDYERVMRQINEDLEPSVSTVFLIPPREIAEISSSMVRGLVGPTGWEIVIKKYVPAAVAEKFLSRTTDKTLTLWLDLWKKLSLKGDPFAVYRQIRELYNEPHRAYHALPHITRCINEFHEFQNITQQAAYLLAIEMALWFHDSIYDPYAKDNEEKSAALAYRIAVNAGLKEAFAAKVRDFIRATTHSTAPDDLDARIVADADLASLGQSASGFDEAGRQTRKEYEMVPEEEFAKARAKILQSFIDRPHIYYTDYFRNKYEAKARENLTRALRELT